MAAFATKGNFSLDRFGSMERRSKLLIVDADGRCIPRAPPYLSARLEPRAPHAGLCFWIDAAELRRKAGACRKLADMSDDADRKARGSTGCFPGRRRRMPEGLNPVPSSFAVCLAAIVLPLPKDRLARQQPIRPTLGTQ